MMSTQTTPISELQKEQMQHEIQKKKEVKN